MIEQVRGFSIPFRIESTTGGVAKESGAEKIKENIIHIILTGVGERVMRRDYGGGVKQLVHDPNNDALNAIVQHQIAKSIGLWEPRVLLQEIRVTQQGNAVAQVASGASAHGGTMIVEIQYLIRQTGQPQSLSVPLGLGGV